MEDDSESLIRIDSVELTDVPLVHWDYCVTSAGTDLSWTSDCLFQKNLDDEPLQQGRLLKQNIIIYKTN